MCVGGWGVGKESVCMRERSKRRGRGGVVERESERGREREIAREGGREGERERDGKKER